MDHEQIFELIPAYVLGALETEELRQVQAHLSQCAICQAEVQACQGVIEALPLAIPMREPPAALKQRILDQAARPAMDAAMQKPRLWQDLFTRVNRLAPAWGMLSLVLMIILAVSNFWLWQRVRELEAAGNFRIVALRGTDLTPDASGLLIISSDGYEGTLVVEHLPRLSASHQYQLWLIRDGMRTSGGVFSVTEEGYASLVVESQLSLMAYDDFGVTIEPSGGSPTPTGDRVLGAEF